MKAAHSRKSFLNPSVLFALALCALAAQVESRLPAHGPLDPILVTDSKVCAELSAEYQELLNAINKERDACPDTER